MSCSNVIRHPEFQSAAVLVRRRHDGHGAQANGAQPAWSEGAPLDEGDLHQVLAAAQRQVQDILTQAEQEAGLIKQRASEQGLQEGYRDGLLAAEAGYRETAETLARLAAQARTDQGSLIRAAESQVVELALAIARKVVERELVTDPAVIVPMVRAALQEVAGATAVRVRVHADSVSALAGHWPSDGSDAELVPDADLGPGDCIVETRTGMVDARIEAKLAEIAAALDGAGGRGE